MLKYLYITVLFLIGTSTIAQKVDNKIVALEEKIAAADKDTTKVRLLCELSHKYRQINLDTAQVLVQEALDLAISVNNKTYLGLAISSFSSLYNAQGKYDLSMKTANRGIVVLGADTISPDKNTLYQNRILGNLLTSIGMSHDYKSEYAKGIQYHLKAREAYKAGPYIQGVCVTYNNVGISYLYLGDFDRASENFTYSYDTYIQTGDTSTAYQIKANLGAIASHKEDYEKAKDIYMECAANFKEIGNLKSLANAYANIGELYGALGQGDSAIFYIQKSVEIDEQIGDPQSITMSYNMLGAAFLRNNQAKQAEEYYDLALDLALELDQLHDIESIYHNLARLEEQKKDYKKALEYYIKAEKYADTIQLENSNRKLGKIEAEHEFNKELAIKETENKERLKIEAEKRRRQSLVLYFTLGIIIVIMFFVYMLIKSLKQTRKQKELVEEAREEIEQKNQEMVDSITYAKRIQNAILPTPKKVAKALPNSFVLYKPKDIVAGDFYWLETKSDVVLIAAADCTGHGVPGAMVSVVCNNGLNRSVREYSLADPGKILDKTREIVVTEFEKSEEEVKDGMDIALVSLAPSSGSGASLKYAGANNPLWIIRNDSKEIEEIKANKQPIGKFDHPQPYTSHKVQLNKGDQFYIFSDGYADQFGGEKGKKYKASNFKKLLLSVKDKSMKEQKEILEKSFEDWRGNLEQLDDVCVIGVRI